MAQNVLITGCTSGFGLDAAIHLARKGYQVIANIRNENKAGKLKEFIDKEKLDIYIELFDVTDMTGIEQSAKNVEEKYGQLHGLVNNAGYGLFGFFEALTLEEFRHQMETNFFGVLNVTKAFLPLMKKSVPAKIIQISSVSGRHGVPGLGAYCASKYALEGYSECLRMELKPFGIDVHVIEPGPYKTDIFTQNFRIAKNDDDPKMWSYEMSKRMKEMVPKMKQKEDLGEVTRVIEGILAGTKHNFRTVRGGGLSFFVRNLLPYRLTEKLLLSRLGK